VARDAPGNNPNPLGPDFRRNIVARYVCPGCKTKSDKVATRAEAAELLGIHRRYFCPAARATARLIRR
jgi:hypothetical protein